MGRLANEIEELGSARHGAWKHGDDVKKLMRLVREVAELEELYDKICTVAESAQRRLERLEDASR